MWFWSKVSVESSTLVSSYCEKTDHAQWINKRPELSTTTLIAAVCSLRRRLPVWGQEHCLHRNMEAFLASNFCGLLIMRWLLSDRLLCLFLIWAFWELLVLLSEQAQVQKSEKKKNGDFFLKIHVFHSALSQPFSLCKQSLRALGPPSLRHYYNYRTYIAEHGVATKCNWMSQDTRVQNHRFLLTDVEFKCVSWNCLIWHFGKRVSSEIFYFKRDQEA